MWLKLVFIISKKILKPCFPKNKSNINITWFGTFRRLGSLIYGKMARTKYSTFLFRNSTQSDDDYLRVEMKISGEKRFSGNLSVSAITSFKFWIVLSEYFDIYYWNIIKIKILQVYRVTYTKRCTNKQQYRINAPFRFCNINRLLEHMTN